VARVWRWPDGVALGPRQTIVAEGICPACRQVGGGRGFGRVFIPGAIPAEVEAAVRRRVRNVARRAAFKQPERRLVEIRKDATGMAIVATSQKLAHRIAHELEKAFGGKSTYTWADREGELRAVWNREAEG
jgi:hypothetical protein